MAGEATRRRCLGHVAAGAALLAGCTSHSDTSTSTEPPASHHAAVAPVGDLTLTGVPDRAFVVFPQYADMAVALGHGDAVNAIYVPEMSGPTMNAYYDRLDGVDFDYSGLPDPLTDGFTPEECYALDSDVHFVDPAYVSTQDAWDARDIETIASDVGPWFGNFYSGTRADPPQGYRDGYDYYTLWELFGRVADVFQERARFEALRRVHETLVATIADRLPPKRDRPTAVRVTYDEGSFYTYHLNEPGYWLADTRPLGARDAFADADWASLWGTVGYETMLDADPDVILHLWGATPNYEMDAVRSRLRGDAVGGRLSAVANDRVYASGMRYQGPIMNLFQLEMTAKQLYPDVFGAWPGFEDGGSYPVLPASERLFDRSRVAAIVTGDAQ
ncbi:ABC transporter substrate-binding protein [Halobacterium salinarum]|uniref:ABC transporter substrate-binding protein n=1 Tax=Halobacterium salinarum TaxID=2242 RepID=UPI001F2E8C1F|nr:ABC transporter substrate-binding protein [Halobacterium salinarum]MCF2206191.1 ABC transporter substrate-binding protein [Halobacterium salinarum]MCF2240602.1 ABC transporter substrate-binding protein [Halobacterium salinarum]